MFFLIAICHFFRLLQGQLFYNICRLLFCNDFLSMRRSNFK